MSRIWRELPPQQPATGPRIAGEPAIYATTAVPLLVAGASVWAAVFVALVVVTTALSATTRQREA